MGRRINLNLLHSNSNAGLSSCLALFSVMGVSINFPEGYTNSYPNTAVDSFENFINTSYTERGINISKSVFTLVWTATLNVWFIGYLVGTFVTPLLTERLGRKTALLIATIISLFGAVLNLSSILLNIPELFFAGRAIGSIGSGISFGGLILFLQEVSPTQYRGISSATCETTVLLNVVLGIFCGMNIALGQKLAYLTGLSIIPGLIGIAILIPLKETPKYLLLKKRNSSAAKQSVVFYHGDVDVGAVIAEIEREGNEEEENSSKSSWQQLLFVFRDSRLRKAFLVGMVTLQLIVSFLAIAYLSTEILGNLFPSNTAQYGSLLFIVSNFIAALFGLALIERFCRRPLVLGLGLLNAMSLLLYIIFDKLSDSIPSLKFGTIVALVIFGASYGLGLGPIAYFITSELVVQQHRSLVQSVVYALNSVIGLIVSTATLPLFDVIGSYCFLPLFIIPDICSLVYLFFNLPETQGEEIHAIVRGLTTKGNRVSSLASVEDKIISKHSL